MTRPHVDNWPKFVIMLVALVGMLIAWISDQAKWDEIEPLVAALVFYAIGNGVSAARHTTHQPLFAFGPPDPDPPD